MTTAAKWARRGPVIASHVLLWVMVALLVFTGTALWVVIMTMLLVVTFGFTALLMGSTYEEHSKIVSRRTLEEVVDLYLRELDNPAPDYTMRGIYREWLREFVPEYTAEK
jgi:Flp pilus assembly protein TadB